jgi:carboxymethylenebutenolidase
MSISRRWNCAWINGVAVAFMLGAGALAAGSLPPFLDEFRADAEPVVTGVPVTIPSAVGPVGGYLAVPKKEEPLPALLLIHEPGRLSDWVRTSAREMAGIGYVVLAVAPTLRVSEEEALAELGAVVRWLRRRPEVLPDRIGVVGWSWGADQALALAANTPLQACVGCYGKNDTPAAQLAGLRATPLLVVRAGTQARWPAPRETMEKAGIRQQIRTYAKAAPDFMAPDTPSFRHADAEEAWVDIYNFLGKYVEDADENGPSFERPGSAPVSTVATIADLMRAVNAPTGVRGNIVRALETTPDAKQWRQVRAQAALMAEAAALLEQRVPPKGGVGHWHDEVRSFNGLIRNLVTAADRQDYQAARQALTALGERCAACHAQHR